MEEIGDTKILFGDPCQPMALPLTAPKARYTETFGRKTEVLPKGWTKRRGCLSLPCDIQWERDVPFKLHDGVTMYIDIFRPTTAAKCPAIVAWSPYGKQGGAGNSILPEYPFRMGIPQSKLSELQKFEGPDPAYWCAQGYAVVNPDPRGVCNSEGNIYHWGTQEGKDGAEVIDWIGEQDWCNGKVGMAGNSWLAIVQWFIAAQRPKHLAAIAPWEGGSDMMGDTTAIGGVFSQPGMTFQLEVLSTAFGKNSWENPVATIVKNTSSQAYYDDKRARVEEIQVPAYVVASWTNPVHAQGTLAAYARLQTDKWVRVNDGWEWHDFYQDDAAKDLCRFFDHYLKEIKNDWTSTPHFRGKILDTKNPWPLMGTNFTSTAYPPPEVQPLKLYVDNAARVLTASLPKSPSPVEFRGCSDEVVFTHTFSKDTTLCGLPTISLDVSLTHGDDADIFFNLSKILPNDTIGTQLVVPFKWSLQHFLIRAVHRLGLLNETHSIMYQGPRGQIRVSRRLDNATESYQSGGPTWRPDTYRPVAEGQVFQVQPRLTPIGMMFKEGERLQVRIGGPDRTVYPHVPLSTLKVPHSPIMTQAVNEKVKITIHGGKVMLPVVRGAEDEDIDAVNGVSVLQTKVAS